MRPTRKSVRLSMRSPWRNKANAESKKLGKTSRASVFAASRVKAAAKKHSMETRRHNVTRTDLISKQ